MTTFVTTNNEKTRMPAVPHDELADYLSSPTALPAGQDSNLSVTMHPGQLSDLFTFLQEQINEKEGWQRAMQATTALLRQAHDMIDRAEQTIRKQEDRIRRLEALSTTDELTGLKNRRGFFDVFMREMDCCERGLSKGGLLVLIDLDNFRAINEEYSHMAGDACLRLVGRTLANEVRAMDTAARLGGDEFVLLFTNTTRKQAARRARDLGWKLNNLSMAWYGEEVPVRASLGLRDYGAGENPEVIFNAADIALHDSKNARNPANASNVGTAKQTKGDEETTETPVL